MDPNAGQFTSNPEEIRARRLTVGLRHGEIVKLKGVDFRVIEIAESVEGRGEVRLRMLSAHDRALVESLPENPSPRNRRERRARIAEMRRAKK